MDPIDISTIIIDPIIVSVNTARTGVQYIGQPLLFSIGMIGCILNIIIFMRPSMRSNSCAIYLHASSWASIFCLTWGVLASMLATFTNNNPTYYNNFYCKLRYFIVYTVQLASRSFIVLASLDRLLLCSNSIRKRQFCRPTIAIKVVAVTVFLCGCINIYVLILYEAQPAKKQCLLDYLKLFEGIYFFSVTFVVQTALMSIFGGLTIWKGKQRARRANRDQIRVHTRDRHLITMLIGQVFLYIISTLPYASIILYNAFTWQNPGKSSRYIAIENFFITLFTSFGYYIFNGLSFYVYTLTAPSFRRELLLLILPRQWLAQRRQTRQQKLRVDINRVDPSIQHNILNNDQSLEPNTGDPDKSLADMTDAEIIEDLKRMADPATKSIYDYSSYVKIILPMLRADVGKEVLSETQLNIPIIAYRGEKEENFKEPLLNRYQYLVDIRKHLFAHGKN